MKNFLSLALVSALVFLSIPAQAEDGPLKARLKQRMLEKMEAKPAPAATNSTSEKITRAGDYTFSIQHQGLTRSYMVHVPSGYSSGRATPLLIAMHGGGGDMAYMARDEYYGLISKSNQSGFIVVFPNGYSKFASGKFATWNAGNCCGDARDKNIDDVGFIRTIIGNLNAQMSIDRNRIFATGMSNGGMMAQRLACEMSDTFRAVASIAGTDNTLACSPSTPISVLNIHAKNDDHVLYNGGAGEGSFRDESKVTNFTSVPQTVANWVARNHCSGAPVRVLSVPGASCDQYAACDSGVKVQVCTTESGAHSWPGGYKPRGETPSKAISANDEMWKFFTSL